MGAPLGFVRRVRALQRIVRPPAAPAVTKHLLLRVAARLEPRLAMPRYRCRIPPRAKKSVGHLADFLAGLPLDEAAYYLSCVYAVLCEPARRKELAMYFTPPALARHIVDRALERSGSFESLRLLDPACGGAAFLLPAVVTLRDALRRRKLTASAIIRAVNRQVAGVERDPILAELSRQFIRIALARELTACRSRLKGIVRVGNALELHHRGGLRPVNVLLCNPPYRKIRASELPRYRKRFDDAIVGQPNLYTIFMRAALQLVIPGGVIALLTPTSYFSGSTYEPIRRHYSQETAILGIDLIHERDNLFLGVEHDVAALMAVRRLSRPVQQRPEICSWDQERGWSQLGSISVPKDGAAWHLPRDAETANALAIASGSRWSLEQYGYVARVGVYVWNRDKRRKRSARPSGREADRAVPVIWASQIGQTGKFRFVSKADKEKRARYIVLRPDDRRGVIGRDSVLLQRTSSRAQRRRLVSAHLPRGFANKYGGFVAENHVIILEPKNGRPAIGRPLLARLFNSEFMRDLYSTTSGTTAVTTSGLHALPLPDPEALKDGIRKRRRFEEAVRLAFPRPQGMRVGRISNAEAART